MPRRKGHQQVTKHRHDLTYCVARCCCVFNTPWTVHMFMFWCTLCCTVLCLTRGTALQASKRFRVMSMREIQTFGAEEPGGLWRPQRPFLDWRERGESSNLSCVVVLGGACVEGGRDFAQTRESLDVARYSARKCVCVCVCQVTCMSDLARPDWLGTCRIGSLACVRPRSSKSDPLGALPGRSRHPLG